jgi:serine/threonine protein kinase
MTDELTTGDPRELADVVLGAAVRAADAVYIEPADDSAYAVTLERTARIIASSRIDGRLATAMIARLALIADLDLSMPHAASAVVRVRCGDRDADVVVTIRHGLGLRADLAVLPRRKKRATADTFTPVPGTTIGQYRIVEHLGDGGMGSVYRVQHVSLERDYALKILRAKALERNPDAVENFLREARLAARIRHPNIVDVVDFGHLPNGRPYLVMELLDGHSLADRIAKGPMVAPQVIAIARQLAAGLGAAHDRGVVHADVTPSNALVSDGVVKLVDFGLARIAGEPAEESPDFVFGTPEYISPEQLRGLPPTDRSDQYGLGAVLFELISGQPPYSHREIRSLSLMHLNAPIPPVKSPHGPLPARLAELVTTCLQKSPSARHSSMHAIVTELDEIERVASRGDWRRWLMT